MGRSWRSLGVVLVPLGPLGALLARNDFGAILGRFWTGHFWANFVRISKQFRLLSRGKSVLCLRCCCPSVCFVMLSIRRAAARMFYKPSQKLRRKAPGKPHEITRNAPILKTPASARSARARPYAIHHAGNLDAHVALATLALLLLVVLCSGSSRCSCFSSLVFRRLQCLRLSR